MPSSREKTIRLSAAQLDGLGLVLNSCNLQLLRTLSSLGCQILLGPICNRGCAFVLTVIMPLEGILGQGMLPPICLQKVA